jgi:NAD(P)-dependent dehydrogenase (short-subunit alcohol dehydrogenase family)
MRTVATFQLRLVDATDDGADARDSIEIHEGVLYGIAAVLPHMPRQKSGYIINVSSVAGPLSAAFHIYGDVFGRRGARPARREEGEYREYLTDEQRRAAGCIGGRMPP